ncbi:MAG TPA: 3-phosphoshikimate 1-carboxyvinyltransferase [Fulvivirga sp.]|nr:3-phosphoshikimate 1-carboxyvinyltransferase [Fulvivirga sp.]
MTHKNIFIKRKNDFQNLIISLPASKSISNRALIIEALSKGDSELFNLSSARDTQTMLRLLKSTEQVLDVLDAGTTMRFLTAFFTINGHNKTLTGSNRMKQRPIGILVDALRAIGGDIDYLENENYPPIAINGFSDLNLKSLSIKGDVSSQYISALMMIAPLLSNGLIIHLEGKIGSRPYLEMTASVMSSFGVNVSFLGQTMDIRPQSYKGCEYVIEPDWSAASYWYSFVALSNSSSITIKGLRLPSIQGDCVLVEMMKSLGVDTTFTDKGAILSKTTFVKDFSFDFTDCPDLAQTVAVICAVKGIRIKMTGLESLRIKETDRISALQQELKKIGAELIQHSNFWSVSPTNNIPKEVFINTYDDHRMAMAFAPLAMLMDVNIEDPDVVNKSYPGFWEDLKLVGITSVRS